MRRLKLNARGVVMSSRPELKLDWCTHEAAKFACQHWHYSKTVPVSKTAKIGVWESGVYIGALIYSVGAGPACSHSAKRFLLPEMSFCELQRVALSRHEWPVSKMLGISLKMIQKEFKGLRCVISYADPHESHHGGIYQASNWIYAGPSAATPKWFNLKTKKQVHDRNVTPSGKVKFKGTLKPCSLLSDCVRTEMPPKHKYFYPLDDEMRAKIEPLRQPYPKRVRSADSGTPDNQSGGGGATPTRTLLNPPLPPVGKQ